MGTKGFQKFYLSLYVMQGTCDQYIFKIQQRLPLKAGLLMWLCISRSYFLLGAGEAQSI